MEITISKKTLKIVSFILIAIVAFVFIQTLAKVGNSSANSRVNGIVEEKITAEKIEIIHFHATQQCWSCITVGDFTEKTLKNRFQSQLDSGRIVFKSINIDLPENREITQKYKAYGSSLFINLIYDGKDHISEEVAVWRLINSEVQFRKYLGDKLEKYL